MLLSGRPVLNCRSPTASNYYHQVRLGEDGDGAVVFGRHDDQLGRCRLGWWGLEPVGGVSGRIVAVQLVSGSPGVRALIHTRASERPRDFWSWGLSLRAALRR